jgi:hypothetical protein
MGITTSTATIKTGNESKTVFGNFNIKLFIYIIIALVVEFGVVMYCMRTQPQQLLLAAIFVPLSLYIFFVYGMMWFGPNGPYTNATVPWPPAINTCPDFLTYYPATSSDGKTLIPGCIDTIGVSIGGQFPKKTSIASSSLPRSAVAKSDATSWNSSGFFPIQVVNEKLQELCDRVKAAGLTWDGVFDGQNCINPDGSSISGAGIIGSTCT